MVPTPVSFKELQPFKAIRENWSTLKPYHDNYVTTISFTTLLTAFLGTVSLMVKHGFKMPRLRPEMDIDGLQPSSHLDHPNEYVTEQDLAEAKVFEFELVHRWDMALREAERQKKEQEEMRPEGTEALEDEFKETAEGGVENAMDILDDEGAFNDEKKNGI